MVIKTPDRESVKEFILRDIRHMPPSQYSSGELWKSLKNTGSEIWLDTGDIDSAARLWTCEMTGLTTNNTLLNKEIQKGIYDDLIPQAGKMLDGLEEKEKIIEIAFILNARHALRLTEKFGGKVSVELHTALANDIEKSVLYAKRFYEICPEKFIIKIPLTPAGYIATRKIREQGIPVNFTLNFSARQNLIATIFSKPSYVNIFLGRLNAFVENNKLGDGKMIGEKSTLASQQAIARYSLYNPEPTKQITASIRDSYQLYNLAGVDVFTIPLAVAESFVTNLPKHFTNQRQKDYPVALFKKTNPDSVRIETLWNYSEQELNFAQNLQNSPPETEAEFIKRAHEAGLEDLFPEFSNQEKKILSEDGKIPVFNNWKKRIKNKTASADALLNAAGLESFSRDQAALDLRIRKLLT